jgi:hypothetical protein
MHSPRRSRREPWCLMIITYRSSSLFTKLDRLPLINGSKRVAGTD